MATEQELQSALDNLSTTLQGEDGVIATLATSFASLNTQITDLKAQVTAGTPVSQDQLDALSTEANTASAHASDELAKLSAMVAPVITPAV